MPCMDPNSLPDGCEISDSKNPKWVVALFVGMCACVYV